MRGAGRVPGRMSQAQIHGNIPFRTGTPVSMRRVQEVFPPHPKVSPSDGNPIGKRPSALLCHAGDQGAACDRHGAEDEQSISRMNHLTFPTVISKKRKEMMMKAKSILPKALA